MPTIKEYQRKIVSLGNTRKITGSMKMISSIKFQKMAKLREEAQPFLETCSELLTVLSNVDGCDQSLYIAGRKPNERLHMLLVTGDRGMCGRYNKNTIRAMMRHLTADFKDTVDVTFSAAGGKGYGYLKRHEKNIETFFKEAAASPSWNTAQRIGTRLLELFKNGEVDEVWITYSHKSGAFSEEPIVKKLLPLEMDTTGDKTAHDFLIEEPTAQLIERMVTVYVQSAIYDILIQSALADHAARMSAMDNASSNCDRLLGEYTQLRNRARQAVITTELNEIVTGKEALEA